MNIEKLDNKPLIQELHAERRLDIYVNIDY